MEEGQKQPAVNPTAQQQVTTPPQPMRKKSNKKSLILVAIVMLIGAGIFLIVRGLGGGEDVSPSPTPTDNLFTPSPTETPESVDKSEVEIEVLNGTGIAGEASFLQEKLQELGFEKIDVGNADDQENETTEVTFSSSLSEAMVDEITKELESIYKDVNTTTSRSLTEVDVRITTGLRKSQTPKPTSTPKETSSPSPSPTESPSPSPTST